MQGTLILICGLPGAGKTTLATRLEKERKALRLCPDEWIASIIADLKNKAELERLRDPVEQLLWRETQRLLQLGVTVILENGFWAREEREIYRNRASELGAKVELHYLTAPLEVLWERVDIRNSHTDTSILITREELQGYEKLFEPPSTEESTKYDVFQKYT